MQSKPFTVYTNSYVNYHRPNIKEIFGPVIEALSPHISTAGATTVMLELHDLPLWSPHSPGNPNITVSHSECKDAAD